ncbi:ribosomal RNA-processing protein 7 homolog A isoform X1 [Zootermopsis nevadensis]|uniref:Ribosomal RNA-processing protein 7-like protein A n=1 Tax=Zootermopsis nevadensis TaxID=136037 RepID=A0A067QKC0_ZOONE|nr:ribosomal RNA-processing protein 7 homolog A isoform X1 [Zootermopsis nevadensis]KDR09508.1 Ribosomal RNA-processing protein 7-like protein A [Zootermopsis nevadensis]
MAKSDTFKGFKAFPVKFSAESTTQHWLYYKEHSVREKNSSKPTNRTLFIINVPPYCNKDCFKRIFSVCGSVTSVFFHQKPSAGTTPPEESQFFTKCPRIKGFKVAYVVFEDNRGLQRALKLGENMKPVILCTKETPILCGLQKWCQEYNNRIPDISLLQKEIDTFMEKFDDEAHRKALKEKEMMQEDEEGWITVTKRGRKPGFARKESVEKKIMGKEKQRRSKKELRNFYRFQIRESKMKHLVNLRKKFEEDKKKLALLKQSRRFKPF